MYFHVYLIYRFTRTFTDHSSVITRCWGFELQNGKSSLKSPQTLATQDFAPASFLSTPDTSEQAIQLLAPIFYSVRARGFCCCPVDSAVPFYQKLILLFFEKEGICCGRCLPFWVETAIGFFALQRFSCTAEMNAADAGMLAVAGGLNGVRCPVLGS